MTDQDFDDDDEYRHYDDAEYQRHLVEEWAARHSAREEEDYAAWLAIEGVRIGNWHPLIKYLDAGYPLTDALREVLIKILRGELKRPNNRPISDETVRRSQEMSDL